MSYLDIFILLCGTVGRISVKVVGDLYITELLFALAIVIYFKNGTSLFRSLSGVVFIVLFTWLLSQIITDVYMSTPFDDWTRGWSEIVFFGIDLAGLILLTELRLRRIVIFIVGFALAYLLQALFFPLAAQASDDFAGGLWKFGLTAFFTPMAAVLTMNAGLRRMLGTAGEFVPLILIGVVNLALNNRGSFGIAMAAVAFGMVKRAVDLRPGLRASVTPVTFAVLIGCGVAFSQGMIAIYSVAAENNLLGEAAKEKYEAQTSGDLGLLLGGRAESLGSTQAILDSPIIGHGSWARDITYTVLMVEILEANGVKIEGDPYEDDLIPTHSHILGSWVEAGFLGGVFWIFVLAITVGALYRSLKLADAPATFIAYFLFSALWSLAFSPFANTARIGDAVSLCLVLSIWRSGKTSYSMKDKRSLGYST
jgi:hypothetical protein